VLKFPTAPGKTALRKAKRSAPAVTPKEPIDPRLFPTAGYRPPTPTAPGLPANFSESSFNGRKLTRFESHVDFAEAQEVQDEGVAIAPKAAALLRASVDRVLADVQRRNLADPANVHEVNKLQMRGKGELNACLRDGLWKVADQAERQARRELRGRGQKLAERVLEPKEVMALIKAQAFDMAGNISDEVLKKIQQQIFAGVKAGKSYKDIAYAVENAIAEYVSPDLVDGALSGSRLMTAIRTAVSSAYNEAKKASYEDPELGGFVLAYQYSSVLDGRTTEWCADEGGMDGRIFRVNNPIWSSWTPPVWYNCRSTIVPITKVDAWDGVESEPPTSEPPEGFK
jgi:SPP1 gp7 family putative phage head morphogenesis protein